MLRGLWTGDCELGPPPLNALVQAVSRFSALTGCLVFRSFLALSLVRGSRGHAGDAWFVDLGV